MKVDDRFIPIYSYPGNFLVYIKVLVVIALHITKYFWFPGLSLALLIGSSGKSSTQHHFLCLSCGISTYIRLSQVLLKIIN